MSCTEILPNVSVTELENGMCRIDSHHLEGAIINEGGVIQSVPEGMDPGLVGLQATQCDRNPAVDYHRVDFRDGDGEWMSVSGTDIRALSGEITGTTPPQDPDRGNNASSDPVTVNAHADGASICISTQQQAPLRESIDRMVGTVYGHSSYCEQLFSTEPASMCEILVPEMQGIFNAHPERLRDGAHAPQSGWDTFVDDYLAPFGGVLGLVGAGHVFGVQVPWWGEMRAAAQVAGTSTTRYVAQQALQSVVSRAGNAASSAYRVAGSVVTGLGNFIAAASSRLMTPFIMLEPCSLDLTSESGMSGGCSGEGNGPIA